MTTPLEESLRLLSFLSLEEVTPASLKDAFRTSVLTHHPDKGGDPLLFDELLSSYLYLRRLLQRQTGGRDHQAVLDVEEVKEARERQIVEELNVVINSVMDEVSRAESDSFLKVFNAQYEEHQAKEGGKGFSASETRGYSDWLNSEEKSLITFEADGPHGAFTMAPPTIQEKDLHTLFEYTARCGKPPVTDLALLPDQMARQISCGGMSLISSATDSFTSDVLEKPEYTDLLDAYQHQNTVVDKLPDFQEKGRTFEELLKERDIQYKSEEDRDLEAIAIYERAYQQQEQEHKRRIQEFFASVGSSSWALPSAPRPCESKEEKKSFFLTLS